MISRTLAPAALYYQEDAWYSFPFVAVNPKVILLGMEGLGERKNADLATFRLLAWCLSRFQAARVKIRGKPYVVKALYSKPEGRGFETR
jgi:hypothetical protein